MGTLESVTLAIALLGACLGVLNTWHEISRDKPKMRVVPMNVVWDEQLYFGIEVTNLSAFPLTVTEIGFQRSGTKTRASVPLPYVLDRERPLPRRLDARESLTFYMQRQPPKSGLYKCAYVKTACGLTFTGKSGALNQLNKEG